ncbi:hypothetical protein CH63R_13808 [Colletotrichum higginsianum IMI 349063]|uniref:Uncharacterized protein n=2 Tax=Colletotrichum higginsianum TaxID=80884 RepID=A0A1B7XS31_COLHI|nr:hypothetical protein CH63R_13808 [Colletotrichum higginsianum IMI 349063]OBR02582.1 hypothetical protein CH63R_13808 [Colletotrichum higginsianum IMI 349063]TID06629.1 hypothetical protein CH35J_000314 [Colletotrichum higginsianum]GJD00552.1 hypothetical protein ColKHC_09377 [Colletotrichum higginsianum]
MTLITHILSVLWPSAIFFVLLSILVRPLESVFYHADLCAAYHLFAAASVYLTAWLNAIVKTSPPLRRRLREIRDDADLLHRLGAPNRVLVEAYLGGYFLLPNLVGPIWICWVANADSRRLDDLAHLYGFAIGLLHAPLLASLAVKLVVPSVFRILCWSVVRVSRLVWQASGYIPSDPAVAVQRYLAALHVWLESVPGRVVETIDRDVLRTEWVFMKLVMAFVLASCLSMLYTMTIELYRPYLQRLAVHVTARVIIFVGDAILNVGWWVEGIVVKRGLWEGIGLWETMDIMRDNTLVTY